MPEDRKIKLVVKGHDCAQVGELSSWASFDCRSVVNDVGEAVLVARYGASAANDAVLDALDTADVILEAYIKPPGQDEFLDDPAWAGFLRDRRLYQEGPVKVGRYTFLDYNHLLARRVIEPPEGASHDEDYDTVANVMRNMVRKHCAEDADEERRFPGFSVEPNDDAGGGDLYSGDQTTLVFGANEPDFVRANALHAWNGHLYVGLETQEAGGHEASIYRMGTDGTWTEVWDGADPLYGYRVTGVHCFAEFGGKLWAGCSQEWMDEGALVISSPDGLTWTREYQFDNNAGIWALAEFDGKLYAGTSGATDAYGSPTYLWSSADGEVWAAVLDATEDGGGYCRSAGSCPFGVGVCYAEQIVCESLREWDGYLYAGASFKSGRCWFGVTTCTDVYRGHLYRSSDGAAFATVIDQNGVSGITALGEHDGKLWAGSGRHRFSAYYCGVSNAGYRSGGRIWSSEDGATWEQSFGGNLDSQQECEAVTDFVETTDNDGNPVLWASAGRLVSGTARVWQTADGGEHWTVVSNLNVIPYFFALCLETFGGNRYAGTGCYAKTGYWTSDHGDVWRVALSEGDESEAGYMGRYETLLSKLQQLADESGSHDFGVVGYDSFLYCADDVQNFQFQVRSPQWGADDRWDEDAGRGVTFQMERRNMDAPEYSEVRGTRPNMLYVLGPSSGEEREVGTYFNSPSIDESPWNRVEGSVDAQSVDSSAARDSKGFSTLDALGPYTDLTFDMLETDECYYEGPW